MPTTTKKPVKKVTKKTAVTKKAPVKRAPAATSHKTTVKTKSMPTMKSFRASRATEPFLTFRVNQQTVYWLILAVLVVGLALWVLALSIRVETIYDQIDSSNATAASTPYIPYDNTIVN